MTNRVAKAADTTENNPELAAPLPLDGAPPLLLRLQHSLKFCNDDTETLQPKIGASAVVGAGFSGRREQTTKTVWLTATQWQGLATIVRQTPNWYRHDVAQFLEALNSCMGADDPLTGLLAEAIAEVRHDPYTDIPESGRDGLDFVW